MMYYAVVVRYAHNWLLILSSFAVNWIPFPGGEGVPSNEHASPAITKVVIQEKESNIIQFAIYECE